MNRYLLSGQVNLQAAALVAIFRRESRDAILAWLERVLPARLPLLPGRLAPAAALHAFINARIGAFQSGVARRAAAHAADSRRVARHAGGPHDCPQHLSAPGPASVGSTQPSLRRDGQQDRCGIIAMHECSHTFLQALILTVAYSVSFSHLDTAIGVEGWMKLPDHVEWLRWLRGTA